MKTYNNTLGTVLDSAGKRVGRHILVSIEDIDARDSVNVSCVHGVLGIGLHGRVVEVRLVGDNEAKTSLLVGLEGIHGVGVGLGSPESRDDAVVEHDQRTTVLGVFIGGNGHTLQEVHGAVGGDGGGRTHGSNEHDGLAAIHGCVEEERGFFKGVGAVGDHGAGHGWVVADLGLKGVGEVQQQGGGNVSAVDIAFLHGGNVGNVEDIGNAGEELVDSQCAGLVACCCGLVITGTGDGAAYRSVRSSSQVEVV